MAEAAISHIFISITAVGFKIRQACFPISRLADPQGMGSGRRMWVLAREKVKKKKKPSRQRRVQDGRWPQVQSTRKITS
jgi:hypothetical protein